MAEKKVVYENKYMEEEVEGLTAIRTRAPKAGTETEEEKTVPEAVHYVSKPKNSKEWGKRFGEEWCTSAMSAKLDVEFQNAVRTAIEQGKLDELSTFSQMVAEGRVPKISADPAARAIAGADDMTPDQLNALIAALQAKAAAK